MKKILADKKKDTMLYHNPASPELQKILNDINILENAIERISDINKEILRIKNFTDTEGSSNKVYNVKPKDVASLSIDYQIALGLASNNTESYGVPSGANRIRKGDKFDTELKDNFYDIMGDTYPSMVALSQKHFGEDIRIGIEDQPISRGRYKWNAAISSLYSWGIKLFVNHYGENDFGDTHSIILLTDSLITQELLKQLDNDFTYEKFKPILKLASNIEAHQGSANNNQGIAEGDALENVVNSISRALNIKTTHLNGNTIGGTWANTENKVVSGKILHGRNDLHKTIKEISDIIASKGLNGKFHIIDSNEITIDKARDDFGYFLALKQLSPVVLATGNNQNAEAFGKEFWSKDYEAWQDKKFTKHWINDKKSILDIKNLSYSNNYGDNKIIMNLRIDGSGNVSIDKSKDGNSDGGVNDLITRYINYLSGDLFGLLSYNFELIDKENDFSVEVKPNAGLNDNLLATTVKDFINIKNSVQFGSATGDTLTGYNGQDHLYGSAEADTLEGKEGDDYLEGGERHDIYKLTSNDNGVDTIFDSDGDGELVIDNKSIGNQTFTGPVSPKSSNNIGISYFTADKKYRIDKIEADPQKPSSTKQVYWRFSVKDSSGGYKALAKLKPRTSNGDWNDGDLGITLIHKHDPNAGLAPSAFNLYDADASAYYYYNAASSPEGVRVRGSDTHSSQFNGSPYDDIFYTGNGVLHYVMGAGGNDYIAGGDGREYIMAGMHNKDKPLQNDEDTVFAGGNSDIVTGGDSNDQLHADDGSDNYEKPLPDESIQTEDEKRGDWISGQYGSDTITGSAKKDVLAGGEGDDTIRAGAGDDLVLGDANYVPSGMYKNISYTEKTIEIRWLSNGNTEEFQDTEVSVPSDAAFKWTWSHDDKDFSVKPGKGARMVATDRVQGAGNDTLHGGAGNDWMAGQAGNDEVHGDDGDDTIFGDDAVPIPEGFASGDDRLYAGKGKDKLHGGAGNDVLDASDDDNDKDELSGDEGDDQLNGGTGGDELNGGAGNDVLRAGKGKTLMDGGTGNDFFFSNDGDDTMTDQDGDDHYYISSGTDSIRDLGMGHDGYHISFAHLMPPGVTTIHDSNGKGFITYNGRAITNDGVRAVAENEWVTDTGAKLARDGSNLVITNGPKGSQGKVVFTGFFNSEEFLGLKLPPLHDDNKPSPEPKPDPKPQPPSPVRPVPDQPKAPTAGKPLAAQSIHEKDKLTYTLAEDTFHTTNKDDKLSWSARLADGKPLPKWLNFDAATRTFSGTPGNDDVGVLDIEISVQGKGGAASQHLALNVINVNDAPQIDAAIADYTGESGRPLQYRIPANAFKDIDKDDTLTLSAKLENGQPLPSWLSFDEKTGQFSGTPPSSHTANTWRIAVTATDKAGAQAGQTFSLMTTAAAANIIQGTGKESTIQGTAGNDIIYVGDNPLKGGNYKEIYGNDGDDVIYSGSGRDHIHGGAGNDILYAGGTEHDGLYGGYGDDIYRIGADFQEVSIKNYDLNQYDWRPQRHDVIEFAAHKRNDFNIYNYGDNLYLKTRDGKEVSIFDQFSNQGNNWHYINEIRFTDRTLTAADIKAMRLDGTVGNDTLTAKADGSWLYGKQGNDHLFSGKGNDYLDGGAGNDTYHFARGFGYDLINNYEAGLRHDAIVFSDMNISDFDIFRERTNLVLRSKDGKDQVVVRNHFNLYKGWQIDSIRFADGRVLDESAINALVSTQHAPQMNYVHPAAQALQMNQAIASLNSQAQPLDALATPDLQPRPLLAAGNP